MQKQLPDTISLARQDPTEAEAASGIQHSRDDSLGVGVRIRVNPGQPAVASWYADILGPVRRFDSYDLLCAAVLQEARAKVVATKDPSRLPDVLPEGAVVDRATKKTR